MSGDTHLTMSGNLTGPPRTGASRNGDTWARIRVASTSRVFDRTENSWRDGSTVFMDVVCWKRLAENVVQTLQKGDPVVVAGRLRQGSYEDTQGTRHTTYEVDAESVGPDLTKVAAKVTRRLAAEHEPPVTDSDNDASDADAPEPEPVLA